MKLFYALSLVVYIAAFLFPPVNHLSRTPGGTEFVFLFNFDSGWMQLDPASWGMIFLGISLVFMAARLLIREVSKKTT